MKFPKIKIRRGQMLKFGYVALSLFVLASMLLSTFRYS